MSQRRSTRISAARSTLPAKNPNTTESEDFEPTQPTSVSPIQGPTSMIATNRPKALPGTKKRGRATTVGQSQQKIPKRAKSTQAGTVIPSASTDGNAVMTTKKDALTKPPLRAPSSRPHLNPHPGAPDMKKVYRTSEEVAAEKKKKDDARQELENMEKRKIELLAQLEVDQDAAYAEEEENAIRNLGDIDSVGDSVDVGTRMEVDEERHGIRDSEDDLSVDQSLMPLEKEEAIGSKNKVSTFPVESATRPRTRVDDDVLEYQEQEEACERRNASSGGGCQKERSIVSYLWINDY